MPPKRRAPASSTPKPPPKPRVSALAKENNINSKTLSEISSAFSLFSTPSPADASGTNKVLPTSSLRNALTAFGTTPSSNAELKELIDAADPEEDGYIRYEDFVAVAALKWNARSEDDARGEVDSAFRLFLGKRGRDRGLGGGFEEEDDQDTRRITLADLKRVARELKLEGEVGKGLLEDMINEANGGEGAGRGVGRREFEEVMRRAGVFG